MKKLFLIFIGIVSFIFMPLDATYAQRYRLQETIKPFSNYTNGNKQANGVFKIIDTDTNNILYFKRTNQSEIKATRRAGQIDFGPAPIIHIVQIANFDNQTIEDITKSLGLIVPKYVKADSWLVTKKIPDGETLLSVVMHNGYLGDGTRLTHEEIDQIIHELKIMRNTGINHTDLDRNIVLHRESDGALQAYILDFEGAGTQDTDYIESELNELKNRM
ncbi:MAG: hypothetical protein IJQ90_02355 [Alphaproteobacteria bacterium]|nr:hypothetical protein [Alphaproteobacteria bacterium]